MFELERTNIVDVSIITNYFDRAYTNWLNDVWTGDLINLNWIARIIYLCILNVNLDLTSERANLVLYLPTK